MAEAPVRAAEAIEDVFRRYRDPSGRASRTEFWSYMAFAFVVAVLGSLVMGAYAADALAAVALLVLAAPTYSVSVRRLHDLGLPAWYLLWFLLPGPGGAYLLWVFAKPSQPGANRYGPAPRAQIGPTAAT